MTPNKFIQKVLGFKPQWMAPFLYHTGKHAVYLSNAPFTAHLTSYTSESKRIIQW